VENVYGKCIDVTGSSLIFCYVHSRKNEMRLSLVGKSEEFYIYIDSKAFFGPTIWSNDLSFRCPHPEGIQENGRMALFTPLDRR
jgi:hypothetical protein